MDLCDTIPLGLAETGIADVGIEWELEISVPMGRVSKAVSTRASDEAVAATVFAFIIEAIGGVAAALDEAAG